MDNKKVREEIIKAGEIAVKELIKVAKESILTGDKDLDISADRLKNAAATKKLAIFDAFDIVERIEAERNMMDGSNTPVSSTPKGGFAESRGK